MASARREATARRLAEEAAEEERELTNANDGLTREQRFKKLLTLLNQSASRPVAACWRADVRARRDCRPAPAAQPGRSNRHAPRRPGSRRRSGNAPCGKEGEKE